MSHSKTGFIFIAAACAIVLDASPGRAEPLSSNVAPLAQGDATPAPIEVIFTGFARRADQGASVFVRLTGEVPVAAERAGRRLTFRLSGAKLGVANNANPLPTEHFGPPVSNVALVAFSGGVDLVIDLSGDAAEAMPEHRMVSQGGLATFRVELKPDVAP